VWQLDIAPQHADFSLIIRIGVSEYGEQ